MAEAAAPNPAAPLVDVVVVSYNDRVHLLHCLSSLKMQKPVQKIVVVDNGSRDGSPELVRDSFPDVHVIVNGENLGPSQAGCIGARETSSEVLLFADPDTVFEPGTVALLAGALRNRPGVCGPAIYSEAHEQFEYGVVTDLIGFPRELVVPGEPIAIQGCSLATSREYWDAVGGFDGRLFWGAHELDYCARVLLAGGDVFTVPSARVTHACGSSTPGGYLRRGRREVTEFRLAQRERNVLATLIRCLPARRLPVVIPLALAQTLATASVLTLMGRGSSGAAVLKGIGWNARHLRETLSLRRQTPRSRAGEQRLTARMERTLSVPAEVLRHGLPRFAEPRAR